jgi:hypothetical protein
MLTSGKLESSLDMSFCLILSLQAYLSSQGDDIAWLALEETVDGHMCFFGLSSSEIEDD